jgi:ubiquinone biosynthesis protein
MRGRFTRREVKQLLAQAWHTYDELAPQLPDEPGIGPRMNVRLACVTLSFHRALVGAGVESKAATRLIADAAWCVFEKWGAIARFLTGILTRGDPRKRMPVCVNLFLRFPFNPPAYRFDLSYPDADTVAIDMHRCPVADYFRAQGAADVCAGTWCTQDFALAQLWGGELQLTGTLARGADLCDFRFKSRRSSAIRGDGCKGAAPAAAHRRFDRGALRFQTILSLIFVVIGTCPQRADTSL